MDGREAWLYLKELGFPNALPALSEYTPIPAEASASYTLNKKWDFTPAKIQKLERDPSRRVTYDARADKPAYQPRTFYVDDFADFQTEPILNKSTRSCSSSDPFIPVDKPLNRDSRRVVIPRCERRRKAKTGYNLGT